MPAWPERRKNLPRLHTNENVQEHLNAPLPVRAHSRTGRHHLDADREGRTKKKDPGGTWLRFANVKQQIFQLTQVARGNLPVIERAPF